MTNHINIAHSLSLVDKDITHYKNKQVEVSIIVGAKL